uniref:class I SAM-dependent methyltransferase n=1 Tax=uncultured Phenylobacterium sp. TaxID=349273 RepID=UPI0025E5AC4F
DAMGMDLSSDFIALARERLTSDPYLKCSADDAARAYLVHDFERDALPEELQGTFDAIILESCLHHFFDPIAAMQHVAGGLSPVGVVLILEGENRQGSIKPEYIQVMLETETLERPYPRSLLLEILEHAGLVHVEFLGSTPGFFPQSAPLSAHMTEYLRDSTKGSNVCVCAMDAEALRRVVPSYKGRQVDPADEA